MSLFGAHICEVIYGLCPSGRSRPSTSTAGGAWSWSAGQRGGHSGQQGLRIQSQEGDAAAQTIALGEARIAVAVGLENMTGAPYLLTERAKAIVLGIGNWSTAFSRIFYGMSITMCIRAVAARLVPKSMDSLVLSWTTLPRKATGAHGTLLPRACSIVRSCR